MEIMDEEGYKQLKKFIKTHKKNGNGFAKDKFIAHKEVILSSSFNENLRRKFWIKVFTESKESVNS